MKRLDYTSRFVRVTHSSNNLKTGLVPCHPSVAACCSCTSDRTVQASLAVLPARATTKPLWQASPAPATRGSVLSSTSSSKPTSRPLWPPACEVQVSTCRPASGRGWQRGAARSSSMQDAELPTVQGAVLPAVPAGRS